MNENDEKNKILKTIGNNIRALRISKGMTQEQLAEKLEHSVNFISLIELGKSGMTPVTMLNICNILNTDVNCLFNGLQTSRIQNKDKKLIDEISSLTDDDRKMVEILTEYLLHKNNN